MLIKIILIINLMCFIVNIGFSIYAKIKKWSTWYFTIFPALYSFSIIAVTVAMCW